MQEEAPCAHVKGLQFGFGTDDANAQEIKAALERSPVCYVTDDLTRVSLITSLVTSRRLATLCGRHAKRKNPSEAAHLAVMVILRCMRKLGTRQPPRYITVRVLPLQRGSKPIHFTYAKTDLPWHYKRAS